MTVPQVLHLEHHLSAEPTVQPIPGITLRGFRDERDVATWLRLREQSFAAEPFRIRPWSAFEFRQHCQAAAWWNPCHVWFAEVMATNSQSAVPVGMVTLARRGGEAKGVPAVHWLAVLPEWRGKGIGRMLLTHLERRCWELGDRVVQVETHSAWKSALALYRRLGYVECRRRG